MTDREFNTIREIINANGPVSHFEKLLFFASLKSRDLVRTDQEASIADALVARGFLSE